MTIVAANPFEHDSRFLRSATSLAADGHRLSILGWSSVFQTAALAAGCLAVAVPALAVSDRPAHRPVCQYIAVYRSVFH